MSHRGENAYRRFRAPTSDGGVLVDPPAVDLGQQVATNRHALLGGPGFGVDTFDSGSIVAARGELLTLAHRFTSNFCDPPAPGADTAMRPLIISGHQPDLFHPGVWFKAFLLDRLAGQVGGTGVHVLIDSDLCRTAGVRAPTGPIGEPRMQTVAYDEPSDARPWEMRAIESREAIDSFAARVSQTLEGLVDRPLAVAMQGDLSEAARAGVPLGLALSRARRLVEHRWGVRNLELPLSMICETAAFARFASQVVTRSEEFAAAYNGALAAYRAAHRLRTPAQPLPDLGEADGWLESPLWVWTEHEPTRRAAFVRRRNGELLLSDRAGGEWALGRHAEGLADLAARGVKLRSRALLTTLYGRLMLGDLFLHGIGGAKYDQVTDDLARRFFGAAPPPHATVSATLRLPIDYPKPPPSAGADSKRRLRELWFHPERHLAPGDPAAAPLIEAKLAAVRMPVAASGSNRARHEQIERANTALRQRLAPQRAELQSRRERLLAELRAAEVLGSREYSLGLFPEAWLREQMQAITAATLPR